MDEKITITRALKELKLLDSRILKEIENTSFVDVHQGRNIKKALISSRETDEFSKAAIFRMQSIKDLIERRNKIKSAILISNSKTEVNISGKRYLVVEAIDRKTAISYEEALLNKIRYDYSKARNEVEKNRAILEDRINKMVENVLGGEKKIDEKTYMQIADPVYEANELKLIDPIKAEKTIEEWDREIDTFKAEVDFVLSESNSRTEIEI